MFDGSIDSPRATRADCRSGVLLAACDMQHATSSLWLPYRVSDQVHYATMRINAYIHVYAYAYKINA